MNRSKHALYVLSLLFASVFNISCDDTTDFIGPSVMPDIDVPTVSQSVYRALTRSIKVDSLLANSSECFLGRVTDPETSSTTTCNFLAQFYSLEDYKLPPAAAMHKENGKIVADSVELRLYIKSYYGDSLNSMKIGIYELDSVNIMPENKDYYTNLNPDPYLKKSADAVSKNVTFSVTDLSLTDTMRHSSSYSKNIRIKLPESLGTKILNAYYQHPEYFKNSYAFIHHVLSGFYFKVLSGNGTIVHIDASTLNINFRYTVNDSIYKGVQRVAATEEVLQNNVIENKNLDDVVSSPDYTLIKSPAGVFTEVTLPVDSIYNNHQKDSVNSAKIVFKRQNNTVKTKYAFKAPNQILMIKKNSIHEFFSKHMIPDAKTSFVATYDKNFNSYTFTNIANLISALKRTRDIGAGVSETDNDINKKLKIEKWESENPDWNKVYLVPVTVETNSTGTITSIYNNFGLTSTKLIGGKNNPVIISVVYSHFK